MYLSEEELTRQGSSLIDGFSRRYGGIAPLIYGQDGDMYHLRLHPRMRIANYFTFAPAGSNEGIPYQYRVQDPMLRDEWRYTYAEGDDLVIPTYGLVYADTIERLSCPMHIRPVAQLHPGYFGTGLVLTTDLIVPGHTGPIRMRLLNMGPPVRVHAEAGIVTVFFEVSSGS